VKLRQDRSRFSVRAAKEHKIYGESVLLVTVVWIWSLKRFGFTHVRRQLEYLVRLLARLLSRTVRTLRYKGR
jgi:hypothetical protein